MSRKSFSRKTIRPVIDFDDIEDEQRRDSFGRKRVEVIQCLLDSSSDDSTDGVAYQNSNPILWLTFAEICHIRTVLAQAQFNDRRDSSKCFRCRESLRPLFFFSLKTVFVCYVCEHKFCQKCTRMNFHPPFLKQSFPVRTQTLIKTTANPTEIDPFPENQRWKTICYDCSQVRWILADSGDESLFSHF